MGPDGGVDVSVAKGDTFWSLVHDELALDDPRIVVGTVATIVAESCGAPIPVSFGDLDIRPMRARPWARRLLEVAQQGSLDPALIGRVWETVMVTSTRRRQGAHYTPPEVADEVVELALEVWDDEHRGGSMSWAQEPTTIWDPACGGGAFLLAAVRALHSRGGDRGELVSRCFATDIDPIALQVCDATLEIWAGGTARATTHLGDALLETGDGWPENIDLIVGNPPFLGQLSKDTTRQGERAAALREKFGDVDSAYLDEAGLFLRRALDATINDGVIALVLPQSLLGAADASKLRYVTSKSHQLAALWVDHKQSFDAAVDVVAVVVAKSTSSVSESASTTKLRSGETRLDVVTPTPESWAPLLAAVDRVPPVVFPRDAETLEDLATVTAGFRQHFYGIADAVAEAANNEPTASVPALVTSGAIDALHLKWGDRAVKFASKRWVAPVLHLDHIDDDAVRDWFAARARPKILLASQTPVLEIVVDEDGSLAPSVPVLVVEPIDSKNLWLIASALASPTASAWLCGLSAGTGLSRRAIRVRAKDVARLALPTNRSAWETAAVHTRTAQTASTAGGWAAYVDALNQMGHAMDEAYGLGGHSGPWWWERVCSRELRGERAY